METGAEFFEHLIANSPVVFFTRSPDASVVTWVSRNVREVLGYEPSEVVGIEDFWFEIVHPDDVPWWTRQARRLRAEGRAEAEYRLVRRDGVPVWVHSLERTETDNTGRVRRILGYASDVTERMNALAQLRGAHAELERVNRELRRARDEAEHANLAKSEFLSGMSHEMRTPLNAILGFAQLLEMGDLSPEDRASVREILRGGRHLVNLVDEVLDIARIEAGNISFSIEPVPVAEVVAECLAMVSPLAGRARIELDPPPALGDDVHVLADRQRIKQVLLNLLSNAIKYNRAGGRAGVSVRVLPGRVALCVEDSGIGIPPERMGDLFKPFDRLGAEQTGIEGTGLGLPLSRRLVEAMGGTLEVDSAPGRGSTFTVELPRATAPLEAAEVTRFGDCPSVPLPERRVIVCIEDNLSNLKLIEHVLERRPGVVVHSAVQGRIGLELVRRHHPDLVLLDLNLPDVHGREILEALKADPDTADVPVVVVSADATVGRLEELKAAGAHAYLTKPLDVARLLLVVDELTAGSERRRSG